MDECDCSSDEAIHRRQECCRLTTMLMELKSAHAHFHHNRVAYGRKNSFLRADVANDDRAEAKRAQLSPARSFLKQFLFSLS